MARAFIGAGSNLGDRAANLAEALRRLQDADVQVVTASSIYESPPILVTDQPHFLNLVAEIRTSLDPFALLQRCLDVEDSMGRARSVRWGPRNIDLDVLLFDATSINEAAVTIPHPGLLERPFVYVPLLEIAPDVLLPDGEPLSSKVKSTCTEVLEIVSSPPELAPLPGNTSS